MNKRDRMKQEAEENKELKEYKNLGWIEELAELAHKDMRKPHEKVVDTTFEKAPAFYDGFQNCVSADPAADCKEGLEHLHRREYGKAHECFRKAARAGYPEAQYRLGSLYLYGRGVNVDYNLAECWFHEAAQNGYVPHAIDILETLERFREKKQPT